MAARQLAEAGNRALLDMYETPLWRVIARFGAIAISLVVLPLCKANLQGIEKPHQSIRHNSYPAGVSHQITCGAGHFADRDGGHILLSKLAYNFQLSISHLSD